MKLKNLPFLVFFLLAICSKLEAENKKQYYYSTAEFAFDFSSEKAILLEDFDNWSNRSVEANKVYSIDFVNKTFEKIAGSREGLSPFAVSPDHNFIVFFRELERQAVLYDITKKESVVTKQGRVRLVHWNNLTGRFYLEIDESKAAAYEYDFDKNRFVDAPFFEFVTTVDSKGPYRLDYFGDDMDSTWSVIQKDTGAKVTEFYETKGNSNQNPIWSAEFKSFWFYPHSKLIHIDKRSTSDYLRKNKWRDISHDQSHVFVYDRDDDVFHVVDAFTGKIQKTYDPFWRKEPLKTPELKK